MPSSHIPRFLKARGSAGASPSRDPPHQIRRDPRQSHQACTGVDSGTLWIENTRMAPSGLDIIFLVVSVLVVVAVFLTKSKAHASDNRIRPRREREREKEREQHRRRP